MGVLSNKIDRTLLKPGDHIYSWRQAYLYAHHGIYFGEEMVIHFTREATAESGTGTVLDRLFTCSRFSYDTEIPCPRCGDHKKRTVGVISSCLDCFLSGGDLYLFEYGVSAAVFLAQVRGGTCTTAPSDPAGAAFHRALFLLESGFGVYDVFKNNCEDFAIYCKTGLLVSENISVVGSSGQAASGVAAAASFIASSRFRFLTAGPLVGCGMYCISRYVSDIGVRPDVIKIRVEDITKMAKKKKKCAQPQPHSTQSQPPPPPPQPTGPKSQPRPHSTQSQPPPPPQTRPQPQPQPQPARSQPIPTQVFDMQEYPVVNEAPSSSSHVNGDNDVNKIPILLQGDRFDQQELVGAVIASIIQNHLNDAKPSWEKLYKELRRTWFNIFQKDAKGTDPSLSEFYFHTHRKKDQSWVGPYSEYASDKSEQKKLELSSGDPTYALGEDEVNSQPDMPQDLDLWVDSVGKKKGSRTLLTSSSQPKNSVNSEDVDALRSQIHALNESLHKQEQEKLQTRHELTDIKNQLTALMQYLGIVDSSSRPHSSPQSSFGNDDNDSVDESDHHIE